jgi:hypothetical protein
MGGGITSRTPPDKEKVMGLPAHGAMIVPRTGFPGDIVSLYFYFIDSSGSNEYAGTALRIAMAARIPGVRESLPHANKACIYRETVLKNI